MSEKTQKAEPGCDYVLVQWGPEGGLTVYGGETGMQLPSLQVALKLGKKHLDTPWWAVPVRPITYTP